LSPARSDNSEDDVPHPRQTAVLFGHAEAERMFLDAYRSGRAPHAWLIGGERGVGKATLAFRIARFVLANPDPAAPSVQKATSLAIAADNPTARRIAAHGHGGLLDLHRVINEKTGKLYTEIRVDDIRETVGFFGLAAGEGGWRVAIVDSVEELNNQGDNALLKILEEPPSRALLLLVSHAPGRVIPTIRSRCRMLLLRPLAADDVARAVAHALGRGAGDADIVAAAAASDGSVSRALALIEGDALELREQVLAQLARLPRLEPRELHALGEELSGTEPETLAAFMDAVNGWLSEQLGEGRTDAARLARIAAAHETVNTAARVSEAYNLDRKPLVFSVFGALAEAAR
jgi:DNA polymerase-3 subunit delta'